MTKKMNILWSCVICVTCLLSADSGFCANRNIYLDSSAPSGGSGTIDSPYQGFGGINWTAGGTNSVTDWIAAGHDVCINLKRGEVFRNRTFTFGASGAAEHRITLQAYGTGPKPLIDRGNTSAVDVACIHTNYHDYLNIDNIEVRRGYYGIHISANKDNVEESTHITVTNCVVDGAAHGLTYSMRKGIILGGNHLIIGGSNGNGNEIKDVDGGSNPTSGADIIGGGGTKNVEISYNNCHGNGTNSGIDGITFERQPSGGPWRTLIHHNKFWGHQYNGHPSQFGEDGIDIKRRDNVQVYANYCYNNRVHGINIQSCEDGKFYANRLTGNRYGININDSEGHSSEECKNNSIFRNIIYGNAFCGISMGHVSGQGGVSNLNLYNNIFAENAHAHTHRLYKSSFTGLRISTTVSGGINIMNNIFYNNRPNDSGRQIQIWAYSDDIAALDYNIYYVSPTKNAYIELNGVEETIASIVREQTYEENSGGQVDPLFTNVSGGNFTLQSISPAVGKGIDLDAPHAVALDPSATDWTTTTPIVTLLSGYDQWDVGAYQTEIPLVQIFPPANLRLQ